MSLPAGYYRIDPDIRALVAAMNVHGFRTYASCQGMVSLLQSCRLISPLPVR